MWKKTVLAVLAGIFLTACSSQTAEVPEQSGSGTETAQAGGETAESTEGSQETIVLRLGDTQAEDHPQSQSYYIFADRVKELTNGRVEVEVFVNSALGNHRDMLEGLKLGTLHITKCMVTDLSTYFPEVQIFGLPYIFTSKEHMFRACDGEIGDYFANEVLAKEDFIGLSWFDAGARSIYNSKRPVRTLEDMKGLLLRVPENEVYMSAMQAFGATGTPMPMGDIYTAIQTGVIDGAENAAAVYVGMKHYESAKYYSLTNHIRTPDIMVMSKSYLESLPEDIQEALLIAFEELQENERRLWIESDEKFMQQAQEGGAIINDDVDQEAFREAARQVWADYTDIVGQDMIYQIEALAD